MSESSLRRSGHDVSDTESNTPGSRARWRGGAGGRRGGGFQPPSSNSIGLGRALWSQKGFLKKDWIDQCSGKHYRVTTSSNYGTRNIARVKTYGEVLQEFEFHPEAKCAGRSASGSDPADLSLISSLTVACVASNGRRTEVQPSQRLVGPSKPARALLWLRGSPRLHPGRSRIRNA